MKIKQNNFNYLFKNKQENLYISGPEFNYRMQKVVASLKTHVRIPMNCGDFETPRTKAEILRADKTRLLPPFYIEVSVPS